MGEVPIVVFLVREVVFVVSCWWFERGRVREEECE